MQYTLGIDETKPAAPFVRIVAPTDIQKVSMAMAELIKGYYPGLDLLNPSLWRKLGFSAVEGPLVTFVQRVVSRERELKQSLTADGSEYFLDYLLNTYGYRADDLADYMKAYVDLVRQGSVPKSIMEPWDYTPTTFAQDVGAATGAATKSIAPLLLGAIAVYAAVTVLLPKLILRDA